MVVYYYHINQTQPSLRFYQGALDYYQVKQNTKLNGGNTMTENRSQDYFDDDNDGHIDTRERNFECENPDKHLGCNLGIDVQG